MPEDPKTPLFDREKFNTDPKFETQRSQFDVMVEDSFNRITERKKKENPVPPEPDNFFDALIGSLFPGKNNGR
jgi:hypothetical protein